jgi:alkylation response protein AidB-like acyl-CoA dehydrogenase
MGRIQAIIECGGPGDRSLRFGRWVERYWRNAVVASAHEGGKARHVLVIQLWYGQTTNGSLHEHCNL